MRLLLLWSFSLSLSLTRLFMLNMHGWDLAGRGGRDRKFFFCCLWGGRGGGETHWIVTVGDLGFAEKRRQREREERTNQNLPSKKVFFYRRVFDAEERRSERWKRYPNSIISTSSLFREPRQHITNRVRDTHTHAIFPHEKTKKDEDWKIRPSFLSFFLSSPPPQFSTQIIFLNAKALFKRPPFPSSSSSCSGVS